MVLTMFLPAELHHCHCGSLVSHGHTTSFGPAQNSLRSLYHPQFSLTQFYFSTLISYLDIRNPNIMSSPVVTMDERGHNSQKLRLTGDLDSIDSIVPSSSAQTSEEPPFMRKRSSSEYSIFTKRPTSSVVSSTRNLGPSMYQSSLSSSPSPVAADDEKKDHVCACSDCGKSLHSPTNQSVDDVSSLRRATPLSTVPGPDDKSHKNTETSLWKRFSHMSFESAGRSHRSSKKKSSSHGAQVPTSDVDAFKKHIIHNHHNSTPQTAAEQLAEISIPTLEITQPDDTTTTSSVTAPKTKESRSRKPAMITPEMMRQIEQGNQKRRGPVATHSDLKKRSDGSRKLPPLPSRPVTNPLRWSE
jgi:hypothetical protein